MVWQRPGWIGSPDWVRSSAWIWLFSSIDSTTAWAGGSTHGSGWWPGRGQAASPAMSVSLAMKLGSCERLKVRRRCDCGLLRPTDPLPRTQRHADGFGHRPAGPVRRLVRRCGAKPALAKAGVNATTRAVVSAAIGALPGLRVLARNKPSTPLSAKRCCHRHTVGRLTPMLCATSCAECRSAEASTMRRPLHMFARPIAVGHDRRQLLAPAALKTTHTVAPWPHPQAVASIAYPDACVNRLNVSKQIRLRSGNLTPRTERVEIRWPSNFSRTKPLHRWHSQCTKTDIYHFVNKDDVSSGAAFWCRPCSLCGARE